MPRIVDRNEREGLLIRAALHVFATQGYHGATMQDVAAHAGVSKGGLYEYFDSKEELLVRAAAALLADLFEDALAALERTQGNLESRLEAAAAALTGQIDRWREACFSLLRVWGELGPAADNPVRNLLGGFYRSSAERIEEVIAASSTIPASERRTTALALMALFDGLVMQAMVLPEEFAATARSPVLERWCAALARPQGPKEAT